MKRTRKHEMPDLIVIAICASICGADGWVPVALFARSKRKWFETFPHLPHGISSHDTFGRVFARLDPVAFERALVAWMNALAKKTALRLVEIDGKTLRAGFDKAAAQSPLRLGPRLSTEGAQAGGLRCNCAAASTNSMDRGGRTPRFRVQSEELLERLLVRRLWDDRYSGNMLTHTKNSRIPNGRCILRGDTSLERGAP